MNEETKKAESENEAKATELSEEDLDNVAGGMAGLSHAAVAAPVATPGTTGNL